LKNGEKGNKIPTNMPERIIKAKPINCKARGRNTLEATFGEGIFDCAVNCKLFKLNPEKSHKLQDFPEGVAQLNPVNKGTGTVCRTETCENTGAIGFS